MTKTFTEEEKNKIIEELEMKYGVANEDWYLHFHVVKGVEKAFAVKAPTRRVWADFRNKVTANKVSTTRIEDELAVDCLIVDVVNCVSSIKEFNDILESKPGLSMILSGKAAELAMSGMTDTKKE
jgi:hypothetical protein